MLTLTENTSSQFYIGYISANFLDQFNLRPHGALAVLRAQR